MKRSTLIIGMITLFLVAGCNKKSESQNSGGNTQLDTAIIATGLDTPWEMLWGSDDQIWLTEREGKVTRINPDTRQRQVLLELEVTEEGESGLLGMALHPDFDANPYVYLVYNYAESGSIRERLVRYTLQGSELVNEEILINNITGNNYHIGSRLIFAPDGKLLMTTGDAGDMPLSQNPTSLNGKLLRINPDGSIPDDNPTPGSYVWAIGFRNSQGLDISEAGIIYASEHGPDSDDEINIIEQGRNYGWPDVRGMCDTQEEIEFCEEHNVREPIQIYTPTLALAGIAWYGHETIPEWNNSLIVTSLKAGQLLILHLDQQGLSVTESTTVYNNELGRLRDVCVSPGGRVFISSSNHDGRGNPQQGDDKIIEIKPASPNSINKTDESSVIKLYPNPANNKLRAEFSDLYKESTFRLYDAKGNLKLEGTNESLNKGIDVSTLKAGIYNITLQNGSHVASTRVLIL